MDTLVQDVRLGLRVLRNNPGASLMAILSLAIGIGAATAIFSVQKALLLARSPYPSSDRLVVVWQRPPEQRRRQPLSSPDYFDYRERNRAFEELGVQTLRPVNLAGGGVPERVRGSQCTASFLRALGVSPALGRVFTDQEEAQGERLVVLSDGLWRRRYGGDAGIVGRRISVNREAHTVVGVMPAGFASPRIWVADEGAEIWLPARLVRSDDYRSSHQLAAVGRLKPGVALRAAEEDLRGIAAALARQFPESNSRVDAWLIPLDDLMVRDLRRPIWFLLASVAAVLLICSANAAGIQFARGRSRLAEMAIRAALGAGRGRVVRQLLTESLLLSVAGGVAGVWMAWWGVEALRGMVPASIERAPLIRIDTLVLVVSAAITVLAGTLSGLAPALVASRLDINSSLREGQGTLTPGRNRARFQGTLVVAQFALALVLAHAAALMMRSYLNVAGAAMAFDTERTLTASLTLEGPAYLNNPQAQAGFWKRALEQVRALPGVRAAGATTKLPLEGGTNGSCLVEGERYDPKAARPTVEISWITPDYFAAMGIPLCAGRLLRSESLTGSSAEVMVNRAFARRYWPEGDAIGKRVYRNTSERDWTGLIVGVVDDVPQWGLESGTLPELYLPFEQTGRTTRHLVVRADVAPLSLARAVREAVAMVDAEQPVSSFRTMETVFHGASAQRRFQTALIQCFTLLALVMVVVGIYGVISYWVAQRAREIGIRIAVGADRRRVVRMVLGRGLALAAPGILLGVGGAWVLAGVLKALVYEVDPASPGSLLGAAAALALVAAAGSILPAWRAATLDPARILKAN